MMPKISVRPAASKNSVTPNWTPFNACSTKSDMNPRDLCVGERARRPQARSQQARTPKEAGRDEAAAPAPDQSLQSLA
jgi:hypothetical protein